MDGGGGKAELGMAWRRGDGRATRGDGTKERVDGKTSLTQRKAGMYLHHDGNQSRANTKYNIATQTPGHL